MRRGPAALWLLTAALVVAGVLFAVVGGLTPGVVLFGLLALDLNLPGAVAATWFTSWSWAGEGAAWAVIGAWFRDGRFLGSRWRWIPWAAVIGFMLSVGGVGFGSAYDQFYENGANPLRIHGPAVDALLPIGTTLLIIAVAGAVASLVVRLRRSRGVERQALDLENVSDDPRCVVQGTMQQPRHVSLWLRDTGPAR